MALTQAGICNRALQTLKISRRIVAISDLNKEATACDAVYDHVLDLALESADWAFARSRVALVKNASVVLPDEWNYVYDLPSDYILARKIDDNTFVTRPDLKREFAIEQGSTSASSVLYTNYDAAELIYTARITDPQRYPARFSEYLAAYLASLIAAELSGDTDADQKAEAKRVRAFMAAASKEHFGEQRQEPEDVFTAARR